jgi:hypothetical protein
VSPGMVVWQAANANGATGVGRFMVGDVPQVVEQDGRAGPQPLQTPPVVVAGQVRRIAEVDRYAFTTAEAGPVVCSVMARAIGSELNAVLEIRDEHDRLVADAADTAGVDVSLVFQAAAGHSYVASVHDVDFRGDRSLVYRLSIMPGPRVVASIPTGVRRGTEAEIEFLGNGVVGDGAGLESVTRTVSFPPDDSRTTVTYRLETPAGDTDVVLDLGDLPELVEPPPGLSRRLVPPVALTGSIEEAFGEDRYELVATAGERLVVRALSRRADATLDPFLMIRDAGGTQLAAHDDVTGGTDAALEFVAPGDGVYEVCVGDASAASGGRESVYRLVIERAVPGFTLSVPEKLDVRIGGKSSLAVTVERSGGFTGPIRLVLDSLPAGIEPPAELVVPEGKSALSFDLMAATDAAARASMVTVSGLAEVDGATLQGSSRPLLVAVVIVPPFEVDAEGKDDVLKWPRGSTFPGPVLLERRDDFDGEIQLEMTSRQGRHIQGIHGPEITVPSGVDRIIYPVFLPEWLETTRTSRMQVNGVARVADPQGNVRFALVRQKTRMGFLPIGALLKVSAARPELERPRDGHVVEVPLLFSRAMTLTEPARLELVAGEGFAAEPMVLTSGPASGMEEVRMRVTVADGVRGEHEITFRATVMQDDRYPVVAETTVVVIVPEDTAVSCPP